MLTKLHIRNFKSWRDTNEIRLAPLTVFFGSNSSGKSSLNQFLLMLKQTAQSPDRQRVLHFGDKNTPIDLGTYYDVTYGHTETANIEFSMQWSLERTLEIKDVLPPNNVYSGDAISFRATIGPAGAKRQALVLLNMAYALGDLSNSGIEVRMNRKVLDNAKRDEYEIEADNYSLVRKQGRAWPLPSPIRFYGFPDEATAYHQNAGFLSDLALALEQALQRIHYLGPLRVYPERSYTWSGEIPEHVGWRGERTVDAILSAKGRHISLGKGKRKKPLEEIIAHWLHAMGLIDSFEVKPIASGRREYEVLVKTAGSSDLVNITDVGFGVSQVLPVLVECFYSHASSTLILEQPEIHLHPSVQASLADLFISAITAREGGADRKVQLLIESHSEHFLRRLQRRIAEQAISPDSTAIYFCRTTDSGSQLLSLDLDLFGNIRNWPENFFGDEIGDLAAMTEAAVQRRQGGEAQ